MEQQRSHQNSGEGKALVNGCLSFNIIIAGIALPSFQDEWLVLLVVQLQKVKMPIVIRMVFLLVLNIKNSNYFLLIIYSVLFPQSV